MAHFLAKALDRLDMSQTEFADKGGFYATQVSAWCRGKTKMTPATRKKVKSVIAELEGAAPTPKVVHNKAPKAVNITTGLDTKAVIKTILDLDTDSDMKVLLLENLLDKL